MRKSFLLLSVFLFIAALINSCRQKEKISPIIITGHKLTIGSHVQVAEQVVPVSGGSIRVNKPGDPLDGLSIEIPNESFNKEESFTISHAEVINHSLGPYFHAITPAIRVENKSGWATGMMKLVIPVKVPPGQFALPFMYHPGTEEIEAMQVIDQDENSMTVATTRFSLSGEAANGSVFLRVLKDILPAFQGDRLDVSADEVLVASVDEQDLVKDHRTEFRPSVDDWQFPNEGSFVSPDGICVGQAVSMLWYFQTKRMRGEPSLFGLYDNDGVLKTRDIWEDDALAVKVCSMLQQDFGFGEQSKALEKWQIADGSNTMKAFCYAFMITHQPQLVVVGNKDQDVHAMVAYGMSNGNLLVADPNYPGDTTKIIAATNFSYQPYLSSDKVGDPVTTFDIIRFFSKSVIASWDHVPGFWHQLAGSIGLGAFPEYKIYAKNAQHIDEPLQDGFQINDPANTITLVVDIEKQSQGNFKVFDENGELKHVNGVVQLPYGEGEKRIGINLLGDDSSWVGFYWVTIKQYKGLENIPPISFSKGNLEIRSFTVNDLPEKIDSAHFEIESNGSISIEAWGPRLTSGVFAYERTVSAHASYCNGPRNYPLDGGGNGTMYFEAGSYSPRFQPSDQIAISRWDSEVMEGAFYFSAFNMTGEEKRIRATFLGKLR